MSSIFALATPYGLAKANIEDFFKGLSKTQVN
jgi:hypothetical protein